MTNHALKYDRINSEIFAELQENFSNFDFAEINEIVDAIDHYFLYVLKKHLILFTDLYLEKAHPDNKNTHIIHPSGFIEINVGNSVISHRILEIALVYRLTSRDKYRFSDHAYKLKSFGRYSEFHIQYAEQLKINKNNLDSLLSSVSHTVYNWLEAFIYRKLSDLETELSRDLYFYVRATFHDDEMLKRFWFVTIKDNKGYCLFDRRLAHEMLLIAKQLPENSNLPPAGVTSHFLSNEADFELMASKDAILIGKCINVPFKRTKYSKIDIDFSESEAAIHNTTSISLYPLIKDGKGLLLAAFPTPSREYFEQKITNHSEQIREIFNNRFASIKKLVANLKRSGEGNIYGKVGELLGGFTKTMIE